MKLLLTSPLRQPLTLAAITLAVITVTVALQPVPAMAKAKKPVDNSSTYGYVATVFDKLQSHWEPQAIAHQMNGDNLLTFTLNEDGSLSSSRVEGTTANGEASQPVQAFLKNNAPFGAFPQDMQGSQLTFKVQLAPDSIQMLSYQVLDRSKTEPTITYAASSVAQPSSLFYTRALPVTPGKVWDKPDSNGTDATSMAGYVQLVQQQVRQNWQLPQDYNFQRTVARLMIDRDGTLLGAQLTQSSGDKVVDKAAMKAITTAGAFPKVPANVQSLPVTIEYVFEPVQVD